MRSTRTSPGRSCPGAMARLRSGCAVKPDRYSLPVSFVWKRALLCAVATALWVSPLCAQKGKYTPSFGAAARPPMTVVHDSEFDTYTATDEESCFPWKLSGMRPTTVSVARLKVPANAKGEYEKACDASNSHKFAEAEEHARNAIDKFHDYSAGWVMLGVILEQQKKSQEAGDACSHAAAIDAAYVPAYLCSAEVSARNRQWDEVLSAADRALGLKSEGDLYAYYYRAMADLHIGNLAEAKGSALQAVAMDTNHDEPSLYLLLAEIYERQGDVANAIVQLQLFLKHPTDRPREDAARQLLAKLESQQPTR